MKQRMSQKMIAHLYGLIESEFAHILSTSLLVAKEVITL